MAGVQRVEVFEAADFLLKSGQRPTIERVRQKIGRGSPNTVTPMLDEWFKTLGARLDSGAGALQVQGETRSTGAPDTTRPLVPSAVLALAHKTWETAQREAAQALQAQREELLGEVATSRQALERERQALEQARERQASLLAELQNRVAQQEVQLRQAHTHAQAQQDSLNQMLEDLRLQRQQAQGLATELAAARQSALQERQQLQENHSASERRLTLEVDRAREAAKALTQQLNAAQAETRKQAEAHGAAQADLLAQLENTRAQAASLRAHGAELTGRVSELQRTQEQLSAQVAQLHQREAELQGQLQACQRAQSAAGAARTEPVSNNGSAKPAQGRRKRDPSAEVPKRRAR